MSMMISNRIRIKGRQRYKAFNMDIPGDFSSATFFMVLAAISGGEVILENLDMTDPQGDKTVLDYLKDMGAEISFRKEGIAIRGNGLNGIEIDMNATPDALPAMAVAGCFAQGETRLVNVPPGQDEGNRQNTCDVHRTGKRWEPISRNCPTDS